MLDRPVAEFVAAAAGAGFSGVGLRLSAEHGTTEIDRLGELARREGIAIHDCEVYRISEPRQDPLPLFDAAAAVGAEHVLVVSDLVDRSATIAAVAELVELGRGRGLTVGLEYMAWTDPPTPGAAIEIARRTGCTVVVDLLHHVRVGAGPAELASVVASGTLGWVQLCDAVATAPMGHHRLVREARHQRLPPGHGALPLTALLACVPETTRISVEVQSDALLGFAARDRAQLLFDTSRAVLDQAPSSTG